MLPGAQRYKSSDSFAEFMSGKADRSAGHIRVALSSCCIVRTAAHTAVGIERIVAHKTADAACAVKANGIISSSQCLQGKDLFHFISISHISTNMVVSQNQGTLFI